MDDKLETLRNKAIEALNSKDAIDYARAYECIVKAESEKAKVEWNAADQEAKTAIEQAKADCDVLIRNKQVDNEAEKLKIEMLKLENEAAFQTQKLKADQENVIIKCAAVIGGAAIFTIAEKCGSLVSRYATQVFKLA